ncbi:MAG: leucine-rich repeat domain-containing protein [Methylococcales bacterium]
MSRKNPSLQHLQRNQQQKQQNTQLFASTDAAFLDEIIAWADANNIPREQLPRDKKALWQTRELDLKNNNLVEIPEAIGKLTNLIELGLHNNQISEIPEAIGKLTNLTRLWLSSNQLREIPEAIGKLTKLTKLNLDDNQISEIPEAIGKLTNLTVLLLGNNQLSEIPEAIGKLTSLTKLWLSNNQLSEIPEAIGKLTNLTELWLRNNQLSEIPEAVGKLTNLAVLNLSMNQLSEIPEAIGKLTNLTELWSTNNQLSEIPEVISKLTNLTALWLENNYLTEIPDCIRNMPNLKIIGLDEQLPNPTERIKMTYQQKILFGSPGTGKSHQIDKIIIPNELEIKNPENAIKTVFHPEYTYGDFVGKLVPITRSGTVQYNFYEGHFLKALAQAYKNIIEAHDKQGNKIAEFKNVALVIDEINRGNSAAIFGTTFQLLDRNPDGWSSYDVSINEITFTRLFELCDLKDHAHVKERVDTYRLGEEKIFASELQTRLSFLNCHFENRTIKIPPNLSILASMNTSDSSIYYMDSAFKRRWEWEFIDIDGESISAQGEAFKNRDEWKNFVGKLNMFIKSNHKYIRGIEDKQIGHYFITDNQIQKSSIQNKLMFFLWDSVFNRDKKPLVSLLFGDNKDDTLITFGDFAKQVDLFIDKINSL